MLRSHLPSLVILSLVVGAMVLSAQSPTPRRTTPRALRSHVAVGAVREPDDRLDAGRPAMERSLGRCRTGGVRAAAGLSAGRLARVGRHTSRVAVAGRSNALRRLQVPIRHDRRGLRAPLSSDPDGDVRRRPEQRAAGRQPALHDGQGLRGLACAARRLPGVRRPEHRAAARGHSHQHACCRRSSSSKVLPQIATLATQPPSESGYYKPFTTFPEAVDGRPTARVLPRRGLKPSARGSSRPLLRCATFLESEYLPACSDRVGWSQTGGGEASYAFFARQFTTTTLTPREIHEVGLKEVARIRAEMEAIKTAGRLQRDAGRVLHLPPHRSAVLLQDGPGAARGLSRARQARGPRAREGDSHAAPPALRRHSHSLTPSRPTRRRRTPTSAPPTARGRRTTSSTSTSPRRGPRGRCSR